MAVRALLECGHRQIAILVGTVEETTGAERLAGYAEELRENGIAIDPALIAYGNFKQNDGYRCMKQLLAKRHTHPFSAVYVTSEMMTAGALHAIREAALQIGRDISLIGFDVHDELGLTTPKITTIRQPEMEVGVQTGQLLRSCSTGKIRRAGFNTGSDTGISSAGRQRCVDLTYRRLSVLLS